MNVIAIVGEPGTGKTSLMQELMKHLGIDSSEVTKSEAFPLVSYHQNHNIYIIGKYAPGKNNFLGTDCLSMAVQPQVRDWMKTLPSNAAVMFEGDRLGNQSFLMYCAETTQLTIYYLDVKREIREERYIERGSNQSEVFLRGRETKYAAIRTNFLLMPYIETLKNEHPTDKDANVKIILDQLAHALSE